MIYHDVRKYLNQIYIYPSHTLNAFSEQHTKELYRRLLTKYSKEEILHYKKDIKRAFVHTFKKYGKTVVFFKGFERIALKILPYKTNPCNAGCIEQLIELIHEYKELIIYPYNDCNDQVFIPKVLNERLLDAIVQNCEEVCYNELLKYAFRKALSLDYRDVIFFKKENIIIKIFNKNSLLNPEAQSPKPVDVNERRCKGYDTEELQNYYHEVFSENDIEDFLRAALDNAFADRLNFSKITNHYYEKYALVVIIDVFKEALLHLMDGDMDFIEGFARFILRENFSQVHKHFAAKLLEELAANNLHVKNFLHYYSGATTLINAEKFLLPCIEDNLGNRWNDLTMLSVARQYHKDALNHKTLEATMAELETQYALEQDSFTHVQQQFNESEYYLQDVSNQLTNLTQCKVDFKSSLARKKEKIHTSMHSQQKINDFNKQLSALQNKNAKLMQEHLLLERQFHQKKRVVNTILAKINQNKINSQKLKKLHVQSSERYELVLEGLSRALMKRKKPL